MHLCDFARKSERRVEELVRHNPLEATKDSHGKGFPTVYPYGSRTVEFVNPQTSGRGLDRSIASKEDDVLSSLENGARSLVPAREIGPRW